MTMIHTTDDRLAKADRLADNANQWLKCHVGARKAYGIPSESVAGRYYLTTRTSCDCEDARRHRGQLCKHSMAVELHCARIAHKPLPSHTVIEGLVEMATQRDLADRYVDILAQFTDEGAAA